MLLPITGKLCTASPKLPPSIPWPAPAGCCAWRLRRLADCLFGSPGAWSAGRLWCKFLFGAWLLCIPRAGPPGLLQRRPLVPQKFLGIPRRLFLLGCLPLLVLLHIHRAAGLLDSFRVGSCFLQGGTHRAGSLPSANHGSTEPWRVCTRGLQQFLVPCDTPCLSSMHQQLMLAIWAAAVALQPPHPNTTPTDLVLFGDLWQWMVIKSASRCHLEVSQSSNLQ